MKNTSQEQDRALSVLRQILHPGTEICTVLRHVSASGLKREVSLLVVDPRDGSILCLDALAAAACGWRIGRHNGIVVPGAGLDVGFWLVYRLGRALGFEDPDALRYRWI